MTLGIALVAIGIALMLTGHFWVGLGVAIAAAVLFGTVEA